jgi:hypothetical protein
MCCTCFLKRPKLREREFNFQLMMFYLSVSDSWIFYRNFFFLLVVLFEKDLSDTKKVPKNMNLLSVDSNISKVGLAIHTLEMLLMVKQIFGLHTKKNNRWKIVSKNQNITCARSDFLTSWAFWNRNKGNAHNECS